MAEAKRDNNQITTLLAVSNVDGVTPVLLWADPTTHRLLVDIPAGGTGLTVGTTTITSGTDTRILYDNAGVLGEKATTGTGNVVLDTSPSLVTPALGVATATSLAIGGATLGANAFAVTGHVLIEGVTSTGATGTGKFVFDGTPTLVTPILGVATGTSLALTNTSATGLVVGANGATNPTLQVDSATASAATGVKITSAAAGGGVTISAISSNAAENLNVNAKSSGVLQLQTAGAPTQVFGSLNIVRTATSAFTVGQNTTNPALVVNTNTGSSATGITITSAAAAGGVAVSTISSGTNESLTLDAKGSGTITFNATGTGAIQFSRNAVPTSSDGAALGTTALMWSDAFFASGAVINFNNGNATLTHATGLLTSNVPLAAPQIYNADNAIAASSNAATVTRAFRNNVVTNSSAATLTITMSTTSATGGDMLLVQILDFSGVAQTIAWVNTENSTVTAPTTSNGSTTLPLTVGFKWNALTSKWRCIASA